MNQLLVQSRKLNQRLKVLRLKYQEEDVKPKVIPKPTIGSSIPPSFVNQVNADIKDRETKKNSANEKTSRKRTQKDVTKKESSRSHKKLRSDSPRSESNLSYIEADLGDDDAVKLDKKTLR